MQWFEEELETLNSTFRETLTERTETTMDKLERLDDRITKLGEHFEIEKERILQQIQERGEELANMLNKFKEEFDADRELKLQRDQSIMKQLTDHEHVVAEKFEKQIVFICMYIL